MRAPQPRFGRAEIAVVLTAVLVAFFGRLPTLDQALLEEHSFRQTQTAYTALLYHEDGVDLMHPKLPVLGEPFEVPFEFPLFQAVASAPMSWGLSADTAARTTGMVFFLVSAALLYFVVRRAATPFAAVVALIAYLFSPFALLWGRTSMIEYLAVAGSLAFVAASMLWIERPRAWVGAVAFLAVTIAMLVKITTGLFWVLPALLYVSSEDPDRLRDRGIRRLPLVLFAAIGIALAFAWTGHADSIKAANPSASWLTSEALTEWNFGTLDQRLEPANWTAILGRFATFGWPAALALISVVPMFRHRQRLFWAAWLVAGLLPIVVFFNLYVVHNYYLAAVTPMVAGLTGLSATWLWERSTGALRPLVVGVLVAMLAGSLWVTRHDWTRAYHDIEPEAVMSALAEIRRETEPKDLIVVEGYDWDPTLLYYARRKGQMISVGKFVTPEFVAGLPGAGYRFLVSAELTEATESMIRTGSWVRVGSQLYRRP
jgi:hypothetical protein